MDMPKHEDIERYGYELHQSKSSKLWYASYEADKGTRYFKWSNGNFELIDYRFVPDDLVADGAKNYRFERVWCSSCGEDFGPGDNGFSHCDSHSGIKPL